MSDFFSSEEMNLQISLVISDMKSVLIQNRVKNYLFDMILKIDAGINSKSILLTIEESERRISNKEFLIEKIVRCCQVFCEVYTWIFNSSIIKSIFEKEIDDDTKLGELLLIFSSMDSLSHVPIFHQEMIQDFTRNFGLTTPNRLSTFIREHIPINLSIFEIGSNNGFISSIIRLMGYGVRTCDFNYYGSSDCIYFSNVEEFEDNIINTSTEDVLIVSKCFIGQLEDIDRFNGKFICLILYEDQCEIMMNGLKKWKLIKDDIIMNWSSICSVNSVHILLLNKK